MLRTYRTYSPNKKSIVRQIFGHKYKFAKNIDNVSAICKQSNLI
jgi:hypothetical protein